MEKPNDELATELTIAWVKAVGDACASGNFAGDWLSTDNVTKAYKEFYKAIRESYYSLKE